MSSCALLFKRLHLFLDDDDDDDGGCHARKLEVYVPCVVLRRTMTDGAVYWQQQQQQQQPFLVSVSDADVFAFPHLFCGVSVLKREMTVSECV